MWTELRPRASWSSALDAVSEAHRGELATITVFDPERKPRIATNGLPFAGLTDDVRGPVQGLALFLTSSEGTFLTRFIKEPEAVLVAHEPSHDGVTLLIRTREGPATLIELGDVAPSELHETAQAHYAREERTPPR
jgi:hypothetical protein